jgi:DNA repair protein SbcC/Rad50
MIKNFLRPKWQHTDAAVRSRAIEEGRLDADILFELAKSDPEPTIRALAISRMQDLRLLIALSECGSDTAVTDVPARLIELLLAADPRAIPDLQILQRCYELCSGEQQRQLLLLQAPYAALRQMAAEDVQQDDVLEQCVLNDIASEVRRAAVSRITNEDTLQRISRQLRGSDKSTARLADEVRANFQQQRERANQRQSLLAELQAFTDGTTPLNEALIGERFRQWAGIAEDADADEWSRYEALHAGLQPMLAEHRREQEQERQGRSLREDMLLALTRLSENVQQQEHQESERQLQDIEARWRNLPVLLNLGAQQRLEQDYQESTQSIRAIISAARERADIQRRLDTAIAGLEARLQKDSLSAKDIAKANEQRDSLFADIKDRHTFDNPLQRISNLVEKLEKQLADQQADRQAQERKWQGKLKDHIDRLEAALKANTLKPALNAHKKAHDLLVTAGKPLPAALRSLEQRLHQSESALRELKSWRNYGADHAREELIKEAVVLRDAPPADVEALAKQLNDLRARWKSLGPLEPGGKAHWEQFDATCTQAHEPVKAQRDAEADERRKHLEQRKAICEQLEQLVTDTDWEQPDWHALDKAMAEARRQWSKTGGVPHKSWTAVKTRYDNAVKDLDSHLEQERDRNFSHRQGLVHKAETLAQEQDNRAAVAAARELREQWQVSVHSHQRKEKQIWQAFSKAMDQIFQKDRDARDQFIAALDDNQRKAEALCEQLEQQTSADDKTVRSHRAELPLAIDAFTALNLPKQARRQLENRFDKACKALEQRITMADGALRGEQLEQLYVLHCLCVQMEALALSPQPDAQKATDFEAQWADAAKPVKEKSTLLEIERRYQTALAIIKGEQPVDALGDLATNALRKRGLCTDLEILLHVESPEADRAQRMQRQIEILENAMKGGEKASPGRIRELRLAYMGCGAVEADWQADLEARFSVLLHVKSGD